MAVEYWIDTDNRLLRFNDDWRVFAVENGAPELASTAILGQPLASFCGDPTTAEIWAQFLARARTGADVRVRIRCDAPERRRWLELSLLVDGTSIRVISALLSEEPRPGAAVLEAHSPHVTGALECCSWCKRWRSVAGAWLEVEDLVATLHLFEEDASLLPRASHTICDSCRADLARQLKS